MSQGKDEQEALQKRGEGGWETTNWAKWGLYLIFLLAETAIVFCKASEFSTYYEKLLDQAVKMQFYKLKRLRIWKLLWHIPDNPKIYFKTSRSYKQTLLPSWYFYF